MKGERHDKKDLHRSYWRKIAMSDLDLVLLKNIRKLYGFEKDDNQFISMKVAA